jgi:hypothetical protein
VDSVTSEDNGFILAFPHYVSVLMNGSSSGQSFVLFIFFFINNNVH